MGGKLHELVDQVHCFLYLWISLKMIMFAQPGSTLYCVLGWKNKMRLLHNFRTLCEPMPSLKATKVVSRINSPTEITNNQQNKRNKNPRKIQISKWDIWENTACFKTWHTIRLSVSMKWYESITVVLVQFEGVSNTRTKMWDGVIG